MEDNEKWTQKASKIISQEKAKEAYFMAVESMSTLNKNGAHLMRKYQCHGATDVTGFGLLGHAENLVTV